MANLDREICPVCNGNGYVLSGVTVYQCSYCDSQGEIPKREASVEELQKVIEEFKIHRGVLQAKIKQQASKIAELENYLNVQEYKRKALS
jgi:DnaJ-class molecular chaperone|tara:strand:- start:1 stop:270 length:270 start_codon:yes stop_codon:yes gene_type:complete